MSDTVDVSITITLELAPWLEALLQQLKPAHFKRKLGSDISILLEQLGLTGKPVIDVRSVDSRRPVRIRVHGVVEPFEPALLARAWLAVAPPRLWYLPEGSFSRQTVGPENEWFASFVNSNKESSDANVAVDCLRRLVLEVLRRRSGCLVGPAQARAYLTNASKVSQLKPGAISADSLQSILRSLLNLGVSVKDSSLIWKTISFQQEVDVSPGKITEYVFAQSRSNRIKIHLNGEYLKKLSPAFTAPESDVRTGGLPERIKNFLLQWRRDTFEQLDPGFNNSLAALEEDFFSDFGLRLPETVLVPDADISEQLFAFKINDTLGPPRLGLKPEELLAHDSMSRLTALNLKARAAIDPVNGQECGVIDAASKEVALGNNLLLSDPSEFIVLSLYDELSGLADRLLSIDDTEYQLAQLEQSCPVLVRDVALRYSSSDLTQTMRGLLAEELSLRNPKAIFERLLQFDTVLGDHKHKIFDDRLPIDPGTTPKSPVNYREFVRSGLANYISDEYAADHNSLNVIRIEFASEADAKVGEESENIKTPHALSEIYEERVRDEIWTVLMRNPVTSSPVILTTNLLRPIIRRLASLELPHLPVLAESELRPSINLNVIGTIPLRIIRG